MHTPPLRRSIYEKTAITGLRLSQLARGATSTLSQKDLDTCSNLKDIVKLELEKKLIPMKIVRDNESYSLTDMIII